MADYIRRDLAKKRFSKRLMWLKEDVHDEYSGALLDGCETDIELLDEIPAADVAEVAHAKWDKGNLKYTIVEYVKEVRYCSKCGCGIEAVLHDMLYLPKYCPECGAKMNGGAEK